MKEETDITWPVYQRPIQRKKNRHSWKPISNGILPGFKQCYNCDLIQYLDLKTGRPIYQDKFGHFRYKLPECILPNTKI